MRNDQRPLQQFRYPALPRWWWLLGLFLLCLAINLGWGLLYYAKTADKSVSSLTFWTHALGYGLAVACALLASILAGFSVMTLRVSQQNRKLAAQHDWQQRRMQEGAAVLHSVLLGPACLTETDRQQLVQDAPTQAVPTEAFGEWRIPDLTGSDSDNAGRAAQLAGALARRLAAAWPVSGSSALAAASSRMRCSGGSGGGILASKSLSHWILPSHGGSGAGGRGTMLSSSGTLGCR